MVGWCSVFPGQCCATRWKPARTWITHGKRSKKQPVWISRSTAGWQARKKAQSRMALRLTMTAWSVLHCGLAARSQRRKRNHDERYGWSDETGQKNEGKA